MKIEQAKTTVAKLWQLFPITLLIYKLLNLTEPKKKKKVYKYNKILQRCHNISIFNLGGYQSNILLSYFDL